MSVCLFVCLYMYVCICMCVCLSVCVCVCVAIYSYLQVYILRSAAPLWVVHALLIYYVIKFSILLIILFLPSGNVGTVHWTAPEILNSQRYQFPADIYSFGMVLYEMAFHRFPFQHMIPMAVMMAVVINRQEPQIPSDAHPELAGLIRR